MNNMKRLTKTLASLSLMGCAVISSPLAVADDDTYWYGGLNIGQSRARIDAGRIKAQLLENSLATSSIANDERDTAYKLFGGYQFNKNFALEGGYFDLGQFGYTATTVPAGTLDGRIKLKGLNLDAVGILPLAGKFSAFGRLGLNYAQAKDNFTATGAVPVPMNPNPSKSQTNYKAGLGLQYDLTKSLGMRVEAERYRINDAVGSKGDINMYSLGLVYRFAEKAPAPVQQARIPDPVIVYVPVKVKTEQYCSILDIQFEINADEMQLEEKERLAVLGTFLKKYPGTIAVIEGHTDNVGSPEKNMELSERRAESVVNYLMAEHNIAASRLVSKGYGETRPIADNDTQEGKRMNRRIGAVIGCAPDIEGLTAAPARITMALEMEFDPYKDEIKPEYRDELRKVANFMKANPTVTATVEGHADKFLGTGSQQVRIAPELAMEVSQRRAQNVVNYLVDNLGVSRTRLSAEGFGQTRRVAYGTTLEGQQENRRINVIFTYKAR